MAEQQPFLNLEFANNPEPRCPCVLLLDTSDSMNTIIENPGEDTGQTVYRDGRTCRILTGGITRMDRLNEGLQAYHKDLLSDSLASQRVDISVITFGGSVQTVVSFCTAQEFQPPKLTAAGDTPMGEAILTAIKAVTERKQIYRNNGVPYYRPWIFFITDGEPTDSAWQEAAAKVREGEKNKAFAFFAVGVDEANFDVLRQISVRTPARLKGYSFREMFVWLSQSQRSVSHSNPGQEDQVQLTSPAGWAQL
ncbi:MAG: VWA domain-containing protein [Gemmatales bacterium]|nr:VWA domain-containing protein [Gemmatales bacterium]MDW8386905.1 VWA domain-containing protein [Gemmatales bacterium]